MTGLMCPSIGAQVTTLPAESGLGRPRESLGYFPLPVNPLVVCAPLVQQVLRYHLSLTICPFVPDGNATILCQMEWYYLSLMGMLQLAIVLEAPFVPNGDATILFQMGMVLFARDGNVATCDHC